MFRFAAAPDNLHWLFALLTPMLVTVLGLLITQARSPHSTVKLLNLCLSRHHLVYFSFYFSLLKGANLLSRNAVATDTIIFLAILSLLVFVISVRALENQEERIRVIHGCTTYCTGSIQKRDWLRVYWWLVIVTGVMLALGLAVVFSAVLVNVAVSGQ
jgi:hypothetical protein